MKLATIRFPALIGFAVASALCAAPALAAQADPRGEPSLRIDTHRIDLTQRQSVARLYVELQKGARKVCRDASSSSDRGPLSSFERCYALTLDKAVQDAHAPLLMAVHQENTRRALLGQAKN